MAELAYLNPEVRLAERLEAEIEDLEPEEREVLARMLIWAKYDEDGRAQVDEIALVREFLKSRPEGGIPKLAPVDMPAMIKAYPDAPRVFFPAERLALDKPIGDSIRTRQSARDYQRRALDLRQVATLLEGAYGIRKRISAYGRRGFPVRYAPSSGGLQPSEVYAVVNDVTGVEPGVYHYNAEERALVLIDRGLMRRRTVRACLFQEWVGEAPLVLFVTCDLKKLLWKYGRRAYRMVHIDAGVVSEHLHLVAHALGLSSCMVAGFSEDEVHKLLNVDGKTELATLVITLGEPPPGALPG